MAVEDLQNQHLSVERLHPTLEGLIQLPSSLASQLLALSSSAKLAVFMTLVNEAKPKAESVFIEFKTTSYEALARWKFAESVMNSKALLRSLTGKQHGSIP